MYHAQVDHSAEQTTGLPTSSHSTPQFLPEYLLGDSGPSNSPGPSHRLWSSPSANFQSASNHALAIPVGQSLMSPSSTKFSRSSVGEKHGGPPVQGLFDQTPISSPFAPSLPASPSSGRANLSSGHIVFARESSSFNSSLLNQSSLSTCKLSPAQVDPFYSQGEKLKLHDDLNETWVTVFGFPPSSVSYILQQFSQYGSIIEHKMSGNNNWVHIHYQSKIQAKKALAKNGKIFSGNMMIGVQPCIDKTVMAESSKENLLSSSVLSFSSPVAGSKSMPSKPVGIRPLTQSYRAAASDYEVVPSARTPQKKNNIVTKAMEYVFG